MVDAPTESRATLHIINYLDWQREGQFTFDMQRAKLLDILARILESLDSTQIDGKILLGGETIILGDVASISEEMLATLLTHIKSGTLSVGPWYIYLDSLLADGESYIRSLQLGHADSERYGIPMATVAFMPGNAQGMAQLPAILRQSGIDAALVSGENIPGAMPFYWQSPDGNGILVMSYGITDNPEQSIENQRQSQPDGPFIWMHRTDLTNPESPDLSEISMLQSTLDDFAGAVRQTLPDEFRPKLKGELYLQPPGYHSGRFAARIAHKQDVMRLRSKLSYFAEPLLALSLVFGTPKFPEIQKSLMNYSWRLLLQNMSPQTMAGAVNDDVYNEITIRNRRVEDNSQRVIDKALQGLSGIPYQAQDTVKSSETYITVWNPHGHTVQQVTELGLHLPRGQYPNVLLDPDGEEQPFTWDSESGVIDFRAEVPSLGFSVYTLKISKDKTAAYNQRRAVAGRSIGSAAGESLGLVGGRLDWTFKNGNIIDLLGYYDGGDAGDVWEYQEPKPDVVMKGSIVDVVQVEATPTYERLIFRNRMRIAPGLKEGKERVRGLRVLDLTTTATYYNGLPGVHFQTQFTNTAEDHRLRVHLRTGIDTSSIYTDSAFGMTKRAFSYEVISQDMVMQSLTALYDKKRGLGLFTRGLSSFEAIREDNQVSLALSLLRSVGWLNKAQKVDAQGAQMNGDFTTNFMLMPLESNRNPAELLRINAAYQAPLRAFQYSEKPAKTRHSYLTLDSNDVVMTALKAPQNGEGLIVRVLNAADKDSEVVIQPSRNIASASSVNFAEQHENDLTSGEDGVKLPLKAQQIATVRLQF